ncbi:thioredoxin [Enterococcus hirae]|uniref:thioredoxin n=1 Tax=Enterococcus TaxID=1350 RepID=UPI00101F943F|nr:thioredoxin [Enterococcus faecium]RYJ83687.1 thioredoxin [Enterococcus faecium]HAQ3904953.1 thioredoxin [Enterococcus faecium]HAR1325069.1 thioredoxin [Enterococcus faecium]
MEELTNKNFDEIIAKDVYVVDFWAAWCGPCKMQAPILEKMEKDYDSSNVHFVKVNVDEQPELATKFHIQSIPTILFFSNGQQVDRVVGVNSEEDLKEIIKDIC